ncbi:hypothetical protein OKA05_02845 [Luteolibacter arcticus]|uniref:Uncharacterized protein n=1 Tax=Luteolibacter arcticus TaxID=1581411 RepID=A0ABT3GCV3_9BACT|nr:hypothetical protein [Luteolibacter arcticus]MCW1921473.1 hypothetical protein [Luteolibacter arcticus]
MKPTGRTRLCVKRRVAVAVLLACTAFSNVASAQGTAKPAKLPGAKQIGLSCAFYANVPALTKISGIQIVDDTRASRAWVASIYGLRRGDFEFRSAFDKQVFFELFGIASEGGRRDYGDFAKKTLLPEAERLITEVFEPALDRGDYISLRALGPFGGPHNVLLLGHANGKYQIHDPTTGTIRATGRTGLAARILSESKRGTKVKKRYFSAYHLVTVRGAPGFKGNPLRLAQLPEFLSLRFADAQRKALEEKLVVGDRVDPTDVEQIARSLPSIDFAVITRTSGKETKLVSAIDRELPAKSLQGVVNLAKLSINSYQIGARDLLPVWWIDGRACVVTGYAKAWEPGGEASVTWFTQANFQTIRLSEALEKLKASGSLIGYVEVPREGKMEQPISIEESR